MKSYLKTKDFSVSGEPFDLLWDQDLDMLVTQPLPEDLGPYYESEDYISHTDSQKSLTDKLYQAIKRKNLQNKIQLIENQMDKSISLLDIGAGTGDFLVKAKTDRVGERAVAPKAKENLFL